MNCLEGLGKNASFASENLEDVIKFIQTICYSGKPSESLVDTRVRLYNYQKFKGSVSLPADPARLHEASDSTHSSPTLLLAAVGCKSGQFNSL